ncbi:MAG: hypothetical protein RLZZ371_2606 [Pseudomonadota bacterium]
MHNASTGQFKGLGIVGQQTIHQGSGPIARRRVHHKTCGFVDHEHMRIFKYNVKRHGFRLEGLTLRSWAQLDQANIRDLDLVRCLANHLPVDQDVASLNELLQIITRKLRHQPDQSEVQSHTMVIRSKNQDSLLDLRFQRRGDVQFIRGQGARYN